MLRGEYFRTAALLLALCSLRCAARVHRIQTRVIRRPGSPAKLQDSYTSECGVERSRTQLALDKAYTLQRHKLDQKRSTLSDAEVSSWDTKSAWRIWELYPPIYNCPSKEKLGNQPDDGGKIVCGVDTILQHSECVVLSFGSNGEPSFEEDISHRTACAVHTFDPTLDDQKRDRMQRAPTVQLYDFGLGAENARKKLAGVDADVKALPSIMEELGLEWIDLLKIDIEGGEWDVLEGLLAQFPSRLPFTQLLVEFHFDPSFTHASAAQVLDLMDRLEEAGLRVFSSEYNFLAGDRVAGFVEYSFLNTWDCRILV